MSKRMKILSVLLCVALVSAVLAGCGGANNNATTAAAATAAATTAAAAATEAATTAAAAGTTEAATTAAAASTTAAAAAATTAAATTAAATAAAETAASPWPEGKDYSTHYVIEYAVETTNLDVNDDDFARFWNDRFNVEFDIVPLTSENRDEMIRIWVSAGDLPDVARWGMRFSEYKDWVDQGLLKELPQGWQEKWPVLAKSQYDTGVTEYFAERVGGYYTLGRPTFSSNKPVPTLITHMGIWMRADWIQAVGAELKQYYSTKEIMEIALLIKEQDPGGVGDALVPMSIPTGNCPTVFVHPQSLHTPDITQFYQGDDGVFRWGPADPGTLEGLKLWRQAYDEGILHKEFYTLATGRENEADLNTAGIAAVVAAAGMASVGSRMANFMRESLNLPPEALSYAFLVGDDGMYNAYEVSNMSGCDLYSPNIDEGKFERFLDFLDYSCTDDGQNMIRMGFEGVDWERQANGEIVSLMPEDMQTAQKYFSVQPLYTGLLVLPDNFTIVNPTLPKVWRDTSWNQYVKKWELTDPDRFAYIDLDEYLYASEAKNRATMKLDDEFAGIVLAGPDVEANWNAWVAEKMPLVQPYLDELTALKNN